MDINLWRLKNSKKKALLDFGFKINNVTDVKKVYIYFPFIFEKNEVSDLGATFLDAKTLQGIFNENYITDTLTQNPKNILVRNNLTHDVEFSVYQLDESDFNVINEYNGTIVSFDIKPTTQTTTRYYRFRISPKTYYPCVEHHRPRNSFFESAFIESEFLDFRINEKRNQNPNLIEKIVENFRFNIININFFVMTSVEDEVISDGTNLIYKRQLEIGDFWKNYLGFPYAKMSVYKCNNVKKNDKGYIDDYSCFAKINYRKSNLFTILKYLFVLFIVTIAFSIYANVISNCIWHCIEPINWRIR